MSKQSQTAPPAAGAGEKLALDAGYIVRLAGTLLALCVVVALLLGLTNAATEPIIEKMQAEKTAAAMAQVLPAVTYEKIETDAENVDALYEAWGSGAQLGYVAEAVANGFGGRMRMVVGVDMNGQVTGVTVTDHGETPNVGSKVVDSQSVLDRFLGMAQADGEITVNSGANRFDGVSGATVSSKAAAAGVNAALAAVGQAMAQQPEPQDAGTADAGRR